MKQLKAQIAFVVTIAALFLIFLFVEQTSQQEEPVAALGDLVGSYHRNDGVVSESIYLDDNLSTILWTRTLSFSSGALTSSILMRTFMKEDRIELYSPDHEPRFERTLIPFHWGEQIFLVQEPFLDLFCTDIKNRIDPGIYIGSIILKNAENRSLERYGEPVSITGQPLCN